LTTAFAVGACDTSKPEFERTKAELASVSAERDQLKSSLDSAKGRETTLAAQIAELTSKVAAPQTAKVAAVPKKDEKSARKTAHSPSKKG
jgi:uncharacterized protein YlxW (UPF0749 family)